MILTSFKCGWVTRTIVWLCHHLDPWFISKKKINQKEPPIDVWIAKLRTSVPTYSAKKLYLGLVEKKYTGWPISVVSELPDLENVLENLKVGPYGRCVFTCDNDVCDNQVVIMNYKSGATVSMTTTAFTEEVCSRHSTICGTKGELTCRFDQPNIYVFDFLTKTKKKYNVHEEGVVKEGHKDSDTEAIRCFVDAVKNKDPSRILTGPEESLRSHLLCFAAERARLQNRVVHVQEEEFKDI